MWFNEANDSHFFLVPGLIVLVMTIIGAFLTAMVVAREWERGTLEALFVTPMRPGEFLVSKILPYFALGMIGFVLCILAGQFLFHVPLRGSLSLLFLSSMIYLLVASAIGLLVSTLVKSQFLASQLAMTLTFLPAMMLSGFIYDLRSMPAFIRGITYALPARYAVTLLQTLYLAGNVAQRGVVESGGPDGDGHDAVARDTPGHSQAAGLRSLYARLPASDLGADRKEFLAVLKDPRSRFIIFLPPLLQCLIFGYRDSPGRRGGRGRGVERRDFALQHLDGLRQT